MLRAAALTLLILVSVAVMLPLVDSSAHNSATPTASRRSHMRHRHSRAWWRRYRARLRRQRAATAKNKQATQTARGRNMNSAPSEADSHNSNHVVLANLPATTSSLKSPAASALSLPNGWVKRVVGGETKFVLNAPNGQYIGGATFSLVNAHAPGETMMTARGNRKMLGGVPLAELRRTVIDKMVTEGGWVVNDMSREIGGHPVYIVMAQTAASSDGRTPQLSWVFYFTEVEGRIYSLAANSLQEFSDRIGDESAQLISTFLANNRALPVATSQR
jgi:hypothetical protein